MKNIKNVVKQSQKADPQHWIPLYYDYSTKGVYTTSGPDRSLVTHLINPNTEADIIEVVERWFRL